MITPLTPHPAALLKTQKTRIMVIADLHIGWEMSLSEKGIHVPTQMPKLLSKLTSLIAAYKPKKLLIVGDIKYSVAVADMGEWHDIPDFFNELRNQVSDISIIRGNHDGDLEPLLSENIKILPSTGVAVGDVGFFHGHRWPSPTLLKCRTLVMGHVHPVIVFRDPAGFRITRQVWVKAKCNTNQLTETLLQKYKVKIERNPEETLSKRYGIKPKASQLFVMPSFNDFLGGRPLNQGVSGKESKGIIGPVLRSEVVDVENAETYLLDGTFLGTLSQLRMFS
ncbi:metallophosphoesterase [Candidatus Bathyarchaeota archaeon]|nr:metallophosphoesterase [Candidatus Bathyarchaeota archaeon]